MSVVTAVVLTFSILEDEHQLQVWMEKTFTHLGQFNPLKDVGAVKEAVGGGKALEIPLYVGSFNYLNIQELVTAVMEYPWEEPEYVQLWVNGEDDDSMSLAYGTLVLSRFHPENITGYDIEIDVPDQTPPEEDPPYLAPCPPQSNAFRWGPAVTSYSFRDFQLNV
jgi:hypothetical protein